MIRVLGGKLLQMTAVWWLSVLDAVTTLLVSLVKYNQLLNVVFIDNTVADWKLGQNFLKAKTRSSASKILGRISYEKSITSLSYTICMLITALSGTAVIKYSINLAWH